MRRDHFFSLLLTIFLLSLISSGQCTPRGGRGGGGRGGGGRGGGGRGGGGRSYYSTGGGYSSRSSSYDSNPRPSRPRSRPRRTILIENILGPTEDGKRQLFLFQLKFLSALESGFTTVRVGVYNCQELFTFLHHITRKKGGKEDKTWNNFHLWLDASEPVRQEEGGIFLELV